MLVRNDDLRRWLFTKVFLCDVDEFKGNSKYYSKSDGGVFDLDEILKERDGVLHSFCELDDGELERIIDRSDAAYEAAENVDGKFDVVAGDVNPLSIV